MEKRKKLVGQSWREDGSKFIHEKAIHSSFHSLLVSFRGSLSSGMSHCYTRLAARVGEAEMSLTRVLRNMLREKFCSISHWKTKPRV